MQKYNKLYTASYQEDWFTTAIVRFNELKNEFQLKLEDYPYNNSVTKIANITKLNLTHENIIKQESDKYDLQLRLEKLTEIIDENKIQYNDERILFNFKEFDRRLKGILRTTVIECVFYQNTKFRKHSKYSTLLLYVGPLLQQLLNIFTFISPHFLEIFKESKIKELDNTVLSGKYTNRTKTRALKQIETKLPRILLNEFILSLLAEGYSLDIEKEWSVYEKKYRTHHVIKLDNLKFEDILRSYALLSRKPMLVPPVDWVFTSNKLHSGGYLLSKQAEIGIFHNNHIDLKITMNFSEDYCRNINMLQKLPYRISYLLIKETALNWINHLFAAAFKELEFIKRLHIDYSGWARVTDLNSCVSKLNTFILELHDLKLIEKLIPHTKDIHTNIYQPIYIDRIGRMYNHGLLNVVNSKFFRSLLKPASEYAEAKEKPWLILDKISEYTQKKITEDNKHYPRLQHYKALYNESGPKLVFLDGTSSMLQIYSLLFGNIAVAEKTNLSTLSVQDPVLAISKDWIIPEEILNNRQYDLVKDRKFLKKVIMLKMYGSGSFGTISSVYQELNTLKKFGGGDINYSDIEKLVKWSEFKITEIFSLLFDLKALLKNNKDITIKWQGNTTKYSYTKTNIIRLDLKTDKEEKRKRINLTVGDTTTLDRIKTNRTVFTGIFHSIDAAVALQVRKEMLIKYRTIIYSIHDCFGCDINHIDSLKIEYKKALFQHAFDVDLKDILEIEDISFESIQKIINKNKEDPLWKEIRNSFSPHCLKLE